MKNISIDEQFRLSLCAVADRYGRGFNAHLVERLTPSHLVSSGYIASVKTGNKTSPEEKRRPIVEAINALLGESFTYQEFLDMGTGLSLGKSYEEARKTARVLNPRNPMYKDVSMGWNGASHEQANEDDTPDQSSARTYAIDLIKELPESSLHGAIAALHQISGVLETEHKATNLS